MVRLAPPESTGFFTLLLATSQLVSTLGRMGMNYSYSVLLPRHGDGTEERRSLLATYLISGFISSITIAFIALWRLSANDGIPGTTEMRGMMLVVITIYLTTECLAEIFWGIHLSEGHFKQLFLRDVWIAIAKGSIPLAGAIGFGVLGLSIGLTAVSALSFGLAVKVFKQGPTQKSLKIRGTIKPIWKLFSPRLAGLLARKGLPFYSVPLVNNLILWPFLLHYVKNEGLASLDGLRVAQICAQAIGILSAAIMPVILIENLKDQSKASENSLIAFEACWVLSMALFAGFLITSTTLIPWVFGPISATAAPIVKILVAGAALQGLSQIPLQKAFDTRLLIKISATQVISLSAAGFIAISLFKPDQSLMGYASVNLISPLLSIAALPFLLGRLTPKRTPLVPQLAISLLLLTCCYSNIPNMMTTAAAMVTLTCLFFVNLPLLGQLTRQLSLRR